MRKENQPENHWAELRKKAEEVLEKRIKKVPESIDEESKRLIHELETHQIELEMQNEELRKAQEELEVSRSKYSHLYDFAPVGYFTFDKNGVIREVNLTGASMLGIDRSSLKNKPFSFFVGPADRRVFEAHCRDVFGTGTVQVCEIKIVKGDGSQINVSLRSILAEDSEDNESYCRTAISNATELEQAEASLAWLASFPEKNPYPVVEVGLEGSVRYSNPAAESLFPDLRQRGSGHPWLRDLQKVVGILTQKKADVYERELHIGDAWYYQSFQYIQDEQRVNVYAMDITQLKQAEEKTTLALRNMEFLSAAAARFLKRVSQEEFFRSIGKRILSLAGDAMVIVSEYDEAQNNVTIRGVFGDEASIEKVRRIIKSDLIGLSFSVTEATKRMLQSGELAKIDETLYELASGQLPEQVSRAIDQVVEIETIYGMPFLSPERKFLGMVIIITRRNRALPDLPTIKTLVNLGAVALKRLQAEEELKNALRLQHKRNAEILALFQGSRAILEFPDFKDAARSIYDSCKSVTGAAAGYLALLSESGKENKVLFLDTGKVSCEVDPTLPMPIRGLRGKVIREKQAIYLNNFSETVFVRFLPKGHTRLDSVIFAPLIIEKKVVGLLGLANKPGGFDDNDLRIVSAFAELAAISFNNSRILESLKSSEERYRSLVQTAHDAIISIDSEGKINSWNKGAEDIFGYLTKEIVGKPLTIIMPKEFRGAHESAISRVIKTGKPTIMGKTVEVCALRKDGGEVPIELSLASMETKGKVVFTGIIRDITTRKQAEEMRRKAHEELESQVAERTAKLTKANIDLKAEVSERERVEKQLYKTSELLKRVFSSIDILIAYMDKNFNFIRVNRAYAEADGRSPDFYVGKNHFELFPNQENQAIFRGVVETGEPFFIYEKAFEYAENPERGVTYWDWSLQPVKEGGTVTGVVLSLVNVTERKMAEKALAESEERFRLITEKSLDLICLSDMEGRFVYANPAATSGLGYSFDQFVGMTVFDIIHPEDHASLGNWQNIPQIELRAKKASGKWIWLEGSTYTIALDGPDYVVGIFKDITFRKYAEQTLRQSEQQLKHLSSQLITAQEQERKRIAREIHDSIGQSLAAIKFRIESSLGGKTDGEQVERESLEGIVPLVQDSIDEARRIQMDLRPPSLDDLGIIATIGWFCREFQKTYPDIRLEKKLDVDEASISDGLKIVIYRICQEALNNVAKHSNAGKAELHLSEESGLVQLEIRDNGKGFELKEAFSANHQGKGMGLIGMKERTEFSGGSFVIETAKGSGTTIRSSWPSSRIVEHGV
jgi:PAS domain S-box-containing protein